MSKREWMISNLGVSGSLVAEDGRDVIEAGDAFSSCLRPGGETSRCKSARDGQVGAATNIAAIDVATRSHRFATMVNRYS